MMRGKPHAPEKGQKAPQKGVLRLRHAESLIKGGMLGY